MCFVDLEVLLILSGIPSSELLEIQKNLIVFMQNLYTDRKSQSKQHIGKQSGSGLAISEQDDYMIPIYSIYIIEYILKKAGWEND